METVTRYNVIHTSAKGTKTLIRKNLELQDAVYTVDCIENTEMVEVTVPASTPCGIH